MNQGINGLPPGGGLVGAPGPIPFFPTPILIDVMNSAQQDQTGTGGAASQTVRFQPYGNQTLFSSSTAPSNIIFLHAHLIGRPCRLREISGAVSNPGATTNTHFGFYDSDPYTGFPNQCLYNTTNPVVSAPVGSFSHFSTITNLDIDKPGWYWSAINIENTGTVNFQSVSAAHGLGIFPCSSPIAGFVGTGLRAGYTFGPMPSTLSTTKFQLMESRLGFPRTDLLLAPRYTSNPVLRG